MTGLYRLIVTSRSMTVMVRGRIPFLDPRRPILILPSLRGFSRPLIHTLSEIPRDLEVMLHLLLLTQWVPLQYPNLGRRKIQERYVDWESFNSIPSLYSKSPLSAGFKVSCSESNPDGLV